MYADDFLEAENWGQDLGSKNVAWEGTFTQGEVIHEMFFDDMQLGFDGGVYGAGTDTVGDFDISGVLAEDGTVSFTKQYIDKHAVEYTGTLEGGTITGTWEIPDNCDGEFEIKMKTEQWTGWFDQGGQQHEMELDLTVDDNGVFGMGSDSVGTFVIRGDYDPDAGTIQFVKSYHGKHKVNYKGTLEDDIVKGEWDLQGSGGEFELTRIME